MFTSWGPGDPGGGEAQGGASVMASLRALLSAPDLQTGRRDFRCFSAWSVELSSRQPQGLDSNSI